MKRKPTRISKVQLLILRGPKYQEDLIDAQIASMRARTKALVNSSEQAEAKHIEMEPALYALVNDLAVQMLDKIRRDLPRGKPILWSPYYKVRKNRWPNSRKDKLKKIIRHRPGGCDVDAVEAELRAEYEIREKEYLDAGGRL